MTDTKLSSAALQVKPSLTKPYAKGPYNRFDDQEQWIRISEGCPNKCPYCRESYENGIEPRYYPIPEIVRNDVKILDMNLIYKSRVGEIITELGSKRVDGKVVYYELLCGIDYRYMTLEKANLLKENRFVNIRLAWDWHFSEQKRIKSCIDMLVKAGYKPSDITVFMICNWLISYSENMQKLDLCKVWNVKAADCWFDNQLSPDIKPIHWNIDDIKDFRAKVRKHNQIVNFKIDPEVGGCGNDFNSA